MANFASEVGKSVLRNERMRKFISQASIFDPIPHEKYWELDAKIFSVLFMLLGFI